jgi:hypothetical protein
MDGRQGSLPEEDGQPGRDYLLTRPGSGWIILEI